MLYTQEIADELRKSLSNVDVKAVGDTYRMVISKQVADRDGETIMLEGIDLKNYKKNPVVLLDHSYEVENIVGKTTKLTIEGNELIADFVFAETEEGTTAKYLYDNGFLKTSSIGFIVKERDQNDWRIITKCELLEWSLVAVPANPQALSLDGKMLEKAVKMGMIVEEKQENGCDPNKPKPEEKTDAEKSFLEIKSEISTIKSEVSEIKRMLSVMVANGKAVESEEKEALARKEILQAVNRATSQALENLKRLEAKK